MTAQRDDGSDSRVALLTALLVGVFGMIGGGFALAYWLDLPRAAPQAAEIVSTPTRSSAPIEPALAELLAIADVDERASRLRDYCKANPRNEHARQALEQANRVIYRRDGLAEALAEPELRIRIGGFRALLSELPEDEEIRALLAEAEEAYRTERLTAALAVVAPSSRVQALERLLRDYPGLSEAGAALAVAQRLSATFGQESRRFAVSDGQRVAWLEGQAISAGTRLRRFGAEPLELPLVGRRIESLLGVGDTVWGVSRQEHGSVLWRQPAAEPIAQVAEASGPILLAAGQSGVMAAWGSGLHQPPWDDAGLLFPSPILALAACRDQELVAVSDASGISLVEPGAEPVHLPESAAARLLELTPDGAWLVAGEASRTVRCWELGEAPRRLSVALPDPVTAISWWLPQEALIAGTSAGTVVVVQPADGAILARLDQHHEAVRWLAQDPRGRLLVTYGEDGRCVVWETLGWQRLLAWEGLRDAALAPDGRTLLLLDTESLRLIDLAID